MLVTISRGTTQDAPWIVSQLREFSHFYNTKLNLFADEDFALSGIETIIKEHVCFVAWQESLPIGFIAGYLAPHIYNPEIKILHEAFWWVSEAYRGGRAGLMLLNEFTEYGRENADWTIMSIIEGLTPVKPKSILKRGFHLREHSYLMESV